MHLSKALLIDVNHSCTSRTPSTSVPACSATIFRSFSSNLPSGASLIPSPEHAPAQV